MDVSDQTVGPYIDLFCDLILVLRRPAWIGNVGKHVIRSPKVFVRDNGLVDALLLLNIRYVVPGHPEPDSGWKVFVVEQLINAAPTALASFYRSSN